MEHVASASWRRLQRHSTAAATQHTWYRSDQPSGHQPANSLVHALMTWVQTRQKNGANDATAMLQLQNHLNTWQQTPTEVGQGHSSNEGWRTDQWKRQNQGTKTQSFQEELIRRGAIQVIDPSEWPQTAKLISKSKVLQAWEGGTVADGSL